MGIVVMKFGGAAFEGAQAIRGAAAIVKRRAAAGKDSILVVVSALAGVTDSLFLAAGAAENADLATAGRICAELRSRHIEIASNLSPSGSAEAAAEIGSVVAALDSRLQGVRLVGELTDRSMDEIAAAGERLAAILFALALEAPGVDARSFLRTDSRFGRARPDIAATSRLVADRLAPLLAQGPVVVTQGYIGSDSLGTTTTLGRGGGDFSASVLGEVLNASEIMIWTDRAGILTCDPQVVPEARTVESLGYDEAAELAAYGAKVLHPATIKPALDAGIPVTVRSFAHPEGLFSTIRPGVSSGKAVVALAMRRDVAIMSVRQASMMDQAGFLARLFAAFGRLGVSVDLVSTSEICVSVSLDMGAPLDRIVVELSELGTVEVARDRSVIAVVGDMLKETPAILRRVFDALGDVDIDMVSMGANDINLSLVLKSEYAEEAVRRLHATFFPSPDTAGGSVGETEGS